MSDRLVELDGEISVLEGARDKLKDSSDEKALRVFVDIMKQLRLLRQERNVLVKTKRAHAKRDPVKRLRALAKVQWDHGSATAASKLEAAAVASQL
jgi:hypothetical protein